MAAVDINLQHSDLEFCIQCGNYAILNDITGWCEQCSIISGQIAPSCPNCGSVSRSGRLCSVCKYTYWLERNADAIESVLAIQHVSVRVAKRIVRSNNRPICNSCGQSIKGGQKGRHYFCTKSPECIKAHNAYSHHIRSKPHREALELAITASIIYRLTTQITAQRK